MMYVYVSVVFSTMRRTVGDPSSNQHDENVSQAMRMLFLTTRITL